MQLSPSTPSDPSFLAALFPAAATPQAGNASPPAASGEMDFEQLFAPLASDPAGAPGKELAPPSPESLFASAATLLSPRPIEPQSKASEVPPRAVPAAADLDAPAAAEGEEIGRSSFSGSTSPLSTGRQNDPASRDTRFAHRPANKFSRCGAIPDVSETAAAPANELAPIAPALVPASDPLPSFVAPAGAPETTTPFPAMMSVPGGEGEDASTPLAKRSATPAASVASAPRNERRDDFVRAQPATARSSSAIPAAASAPTIPVGNRPALPLSHTASVSTGVAAFPHEEMPASPATSSAAFSAMPPAPSSPSADEPQLDGPMPDAAANRFQSAPDLPRPLADPPVAAAKFAAERLVSPSSARETSEHANKSFLNATPERLAQRDKTFGTGVANAAAAMPTPASSASQPHPTFEYADAAATPSTFVAPSDFVPAVSAFPAVDATSQASQTSAVPAGVSEVPDVQRAVEVVLHAADRVAERAQSAVKLEFSVGDADLIVRVELQDGEVHATFRTDSPDLRDALAQEWQAVVSAQGDRSIRLAPAQFANTDHHAPDASGGHGSSQQHGRPPAEREDPPSFMPAFARAAHAAANTLAATSGAAVPSRAPAPAGTAQRLHLFA